MIFSVQLLFHFFKILHAPEEIKSGLVKSYRN